MKPIKLCWGCQNKLLSYVHYKPEIGDHVVIINNHVGHDIPIGTIMEVKKLAPMPNKMVISDSEVSPKANHGMDIWIAECDYVLINTPKD